MSLCVQELSQLTAKGGAHAIQMGSKVAFLDSRGFDDGNTGTARMVVVMMAAPRRRDRVATVLTVSGMKVSWCVLVRRGCRRQNGQGRDDVIVILFSKIVTEAVTRLLCQLRLLGAHIGTSSRHGGGGGGVVVVVVVIDMRVNQVKK